MVESRFASSLPSIKASVITIPLLYLSIPWPYLKILHIQKLYNKALKLNRSLNVLFPRIVFQKDYTLKQFFLREVSMIFMLKITTHFQDVKFKEKNFKMQNIPLGTRIYQICCCQVATDYQKRWTNLNLFKFIFNNLYPNWTEEKETSDKYFSSMSVV